MATRRDELKTRKPPCDDRFFVAIVENSADFIFTKDRQFRYLSINSAAAAVIGKQAHEIIGKDDFFLFPAEDARNIREFETALLTHGQTQTIVETLPIAGKLRHLSTMKIAVRNADGEIIGLAGISRDISDLANAEIALLKSAAEERARRAEIATMMEAIPAAVCIAHDPLCRKMTGNRAVHDLLQVPRGKNMSKSAPDGEKPVNFDVYTCGRKLGPEELPVQQAAASGKAVRDVELELRFDDGSERTIFGSALPLFDEKHAPRGAVGAFLDVSEYKRLQRKLKFANSAKDNFLATLGHELRNPLGVLSNCLNTEISTSAAEKKPLNPKTQMMQRQVQHLKRMIDDLLDVSRIARGKLLLRQKYIDLTDVVSVAVETSRPHIENSKHEWIQKIEPLPIIVNGDSDRLVQLFSNLLINAAKFTPAEGRIYLTVGQNGSEAVVSIRDSGIGIPEDMKELIFTAYTQLDNSESKQLGGLGLGLSLVKHIVELHAGTVEVHSEGIGTGAEFVVRLPLVKVDNRNPLAG